ncbi:MAG TPA: MFS transporter [Marmoricola sp.]|nr:MFS transporter [Marmoricola sp.]
MTSDVSSPAPEAGTSKALLSVIVLCFGGLSAALTQTLVIPIQSELPQLLHTSPANAGWVVTSTLLAAAVSMPIAGRLADMFGKQRVLMVTAALLVVGSLICAQADSLMPMLAGRAFQGLAAGFIPVGISLMREITPPHMTTSAISAMSATLGVGGAIGLPLAAWVAQDFNWHALFWMSAGLALLVSIGVALVVPHVHDATGGRIDVVGALGLAAGLVSTLVAVSKGNTWGWDSPRTLGFLVGGVVVLLVWGWYELRVTDPLCDLRVTAQAPVLLTNLAAVAIGFGMMAQAIVVPQLLQLPTQTGFGLGQTILEAGLWMAPGGLMMMLFAPLSGRLMESWGAKRTLMLGAAVLGIGYVVAVFLMNSPVQLLIASCIASAGVGIGYAAMPTLILNAVPRREAASAVGINALMRSVGTTVAAAVMAMLLTGSTTDFGGFAVPTESAFRVCFVVGAAAAFLGMLIAAAVPLARRRDENRVGAAAATREEHAAAATR